MIGGNCFLCGSTQARILPFLFHSSPLKSYLKLGVYLHVYQSQGGYMKLNAFKLFSLVKLVQWPWKQLPVLKSFLRTKHAKQKGSRTQLSSVPKAPPPGGLSGVWSSLFKHYYTWKIFVVLGYQCRIGINGMSRHAQSSKATQFSIENHTFGTPRWSMKYSGCDITFY